MLSKTLFLYSMSNTSMIKHGAGFWTPHGTKKTIFLSIYLYLFLTNFTLIHLGQYAEN